MSQKLPKIAKKGSGCTKKIHKKITKRKLKILTLFSVLKALNYIIQKNLSDRIKNVKVISFYKSVNKNQDG